MIVKFQRYCGLGVIIVSASYWVFYLLPMLNASPNVEDMPVLHQGQRRMCAVVIEAWWNVERSSNARQLCDDLQKHGVPCRRFQAIRVTEAKMQKSLYADIIRGNHPSWFRKDHAIYVGQFLSHATVLKQIVGRGSRSCPWTLVLQDDAYIEDRFYNAMDGMFAHLPAGPSWLTLYTCGGPGAESRFGSGPFQKTKQWRWRQFSDAALLWSMSAATNAVQHLPLSNDFDPNPDTDWMTCLLRRCILNEYVYADVASPLIYPRGFASTRETLGAGRRLKEVAESFQGSQHQLEPRGQSLQEVAYRGLEWSWCALQYTRSLQVVDNLYRNVTQRKGPGLGKGTRDCR